MTSEKKNNNIGLFYGIISFVFWGLSPLYFKLLTSVPPAEILAHRIIWSALLLIGIIIFRSQLKIALNMLKDRKVMLILLTTTILISINWFVFIYVIDQGRILEASLGYFINPLVSIVLGLIFLKERLSKFGIISVILAFIGVMFQMVEGLGIPWPSLLLAFSFGFYGLLRKIVKVNAVVGLAVETALLAPVALIYLYILDQSGDLKFGSIAIELTLLLCLAGLVTTLPLIWFTKAARRVDLSTIGFMQYLAPSINFIIALSFGEIFTFAHAVSFGCIWAALIIFTIDSVYNKPVLAKQ